MLCTRMSCPPPPPPAAGRARRFRCLMDNVGKGGFRCASPRRQGAARMAGPAVAKPPAVVCCALLATSPVLRRLLPLPLLLSCCSEECKQAVLDVAAASQSDYRLNYGIGAACRVGAHPTLPHASSWLLCSAQVSRPLRVLAAGPAMLRAGQLAAQAGHTHTAHTRGDAFPVHPAGRRRGAVRGGEAAAAGGAGPRRGAAVPGGQVHGAVGCVFGFGCGVGKGGAGV